MANIKEIDLDKNVVIFIPEGMGTKEQNAINIAKYKGYKDKIDSSVDVTNLGTKEENDAIIATLTPHHRLVSNRLVEPATETTENKYLLKYVDHTRIDNPQSIVEFGLGFALTILGNLAVEASKHVATIELKSEQATTVSSIEQGMRNVFGGSTIE
jgi:hypothetical protein